MRDEREPISRGQLDRRAADRRALGHTLWLVDFFAVVVLVNGILAILGSWPGGALVAAAAGVLATIAWWGRADQTG